MKCAPLFTSLIISLLSAILQCSSPEIVNKQNTLMAFENITIDELKIMTETGNISKAQVNIRGKVIKRFICPPCPEGYDCEQCPPNHIVVSDEKSSITITCHPEYFTENEEYCFSLERKKHIDGFPFNIIGWEKKPGKRCHPCKQDLNK